MFGSIGYPELILLGIVAILLFGQRLPEVARSLGGSYREFRKSLNELQRNFEVDADDMSPNTSRLPEYQNDFDDVDEPSGQAFEPPADGGDHDQDSAS